MLWFVALAVSDLLEAEKFMNFLRLGFTLLCNEDMDTHHEFLSMFGKACLKIEMT